MGTIVYRNMKTKAFRIFSQVFGGWLQSEGFLYVGEGEYERKELTCFHSLAFAPQKNTDFFDFSIGCGIRMPYVNELIASEYWDGHESTVGLPINKLIGRDYLVAWPYHDRSDLEKMKGEIVTIILSHCYSFFDRYSDPNELFMWMSSTDNNHWFMHSGSSRGAVLVALCCYLKGADNALKLGIDLLRDFQGRNPRFGEELKRTIAKIESMCSSGEIGEYYSRHGCKHTN